MAVVLRRERRRRPKGSGPDWALAARALTGDSGAVLGGRPGDEVAPFGAKDPCATAPVLPPEQGVGLDAIASSRLASARARRATQPASAT